MRRSWYELAEAIRIALEQVNVHRMRSLLTALGVIIGIVAVTLMGTAIKGIDIGFRDSLSMLGNDVFYVEKFPWKDVGDEWMMYRNRPNMKSSYADDLNQIIAGTTDSNLVIAVPTVGSRQRIDRDQRNIGGVEVIGTNSDFTLINTGDIEHGRFFTDNEALAGRNVIVLGYDVANTLFPEGVEQAVGKDVRVRNIRFRVVGVFARQGSFLGLQSFDSNGVIPLLSLRKFFVNRWWDTTTIRVKKHPDATIAEARDEIIGAMRRVRGLEPGEAEDFEVNQSDMIEKQLGPVKMGIAVAGFFVTGLALFVGAIGIMNITFVSVKERTREIGTRRAVGARRRAILLQFLVESCMICLLGGLVGLGCSWGIKSVVMKVAPHFPLVMSMELIVLAVLIAVGTGLVSGFAPAFQAARLDPAEALRHE
ncbi:MAG: ABC transporter permease [Opitutales bacterium]|nr:ABC transporter permease [Opitutales bacterium]